MQKLLHEMVRERRLVCDGAIGTQLMLAGLEIPPVDSPRTAVKVAIAAEARGKK